MATVIRLKRGGRNHAPYYRIVVTDAHKKMTGRVIEEIGLYHPCARPEPITTVKEDRALEWLSKGAQPSDTVRSILSKAGTIAKHAGTAKAEEPEAEVTATEEATSEQPGEAAAE
jgi:small subunit ribosomal protein S16|tara:strand:- start:167 stop:511 length:345 start_codon:yes stop_codon:yes gene_type:complete